jgi:repressor LexA
LTREWVFSKLNVSGTASRACTTFSSLEQPMSTPPANDELSPRQRDVLDFIATMLEQRGIPPTYREIGDALGIASTNGVADHVKALERKGFIAKEGGGAARGLRLTEKAGPTRRGDTVSVPIVGTVAAGLPVLAEENYERSFHIDRSLLRGGGQVFALKVRGDSMIEEGIFQDDLVIVRRQDSARNGDIVVALVDGEATVKFFFREGERIRLQPAHPTMEPIYVDGRSTTLVQGVVIGVWREY